MMSQKEYTYLRLIDPENNMFTEFGASTRGMKSLSTIAEPLTNAFGEAAVGLSVENLVRIEGVSAKDVESLLTKSGISREQYEFVTP